MTEEEISEKIQANIVKLATVARQLRQAELANNPDKVRQLKKREKKIIETNNRLLLELEEKY